MNSERYIGLEVHQATIVVAVTGFGWHELGFVEAGRRADLLSLQQIQR